VSSRGRYAALPESDRATMQGLLPGGLVVRRYPQSPGDPVDFDFGDFAVGRELQQQFAVAFARRTAPGSGISSMASFRAHFRSVRAFSEYLSSLPRAPARATSITAAHFDGFIQSISHRPTSSQHHTFIYLRDVLRHLDSLTPGLASQLKRRDLRRDQRLGTRTSYSRGEFRRIAEAARDDLRAAARRIRSNRKLLAKYRSGSILDTSRRLELLDYVERHADVPRGEPGTWRERLVARWVEDGQFGSPKDIISWTHLTTNEVAAGSILLAVLTGQNPSVILNCSVSHHRSDGEAGGVATAILDARKPRRGRRAFMDVPLEDIPDWISCPTKPDAMMSSRDELHTPFGVYRLLVELTASSRAITKTNELLVGYCTTGHGPKMGSRGVRRQAHHGWIPRWTREHALLTDPAGDNGPVPLEVTMVRLRLTYIELHQKPVAHTDATLVRDYLGRNRGNLDEYRQVVADALSEEVTKARAHATLITLSAAQVSHALAEPAVAAAQSGLSVATVTKMLEANLTR
jgi:hypothetical protein